MFRFEEELRRIDKTVSLPYWDYTIDTQMDNPVNSLLWSAKFFGNGNGRVVIGDFRDWRSPNGPIRRRYGESNYGQLMNRDAVKAIVTKCHNKVCSSIKHMEQCKINILAYQKFWGGNPTEPRYGSETVISGLIFSCEAHTNEIY